MSFIRKIPGFRSGKKWKMILASICYFFIFIIILGALFGGSPSDEQPYISQTPSDKEQSLITKTPSEMLPRRSDLSTEWIFGDLKDININNTEFESGSQQEIRIGTGFSRNLITISIYKFLSTTASNDYYTNRTTGDYYLQRGGYKEVNMRTSAKCEAYKVDKISAELGQVYCVKSNIFFELKVVSETFESEKYLKDIGKIVDQKIS